jgi:phosphoribosylamine--glycine ligase
MKILVVGQGGREHALVRALSLSPSVTSVLCVPGSDGIALDCRCEKIDFDILPQWSLQQKIDLIVIGPEQPLSQKMSDQMRALGLKVFAPSYESARLEFSKIFSKEFLIEAGIPTARAFVVNSVESTLEKSKNFAAPWVLKADGLCAGNGVVICFTLKELEQAAREFFEEKKFGEAGARALLEEFESGYEISYHILTNGQEFVSLPLSQDHKRLKDHDQGPNTGGMGTIAPVPIDLDLDREIREKILAPTVKALSQKGLVYRGVLYVGLMITSDGPKVIEYNCRFGDPETQVLLPLIDEDLAQVFSQVADGELPEVKFFKKYAACVVLAAEGYPEKPVLGAVIAGIGTEPTTSAPINAIPSLNDSGSSSQEVKLNQNRYFLHSGTKLRESQWETAGGRVLNSVGVASNLEDAVRFAYIQASKVKWAGMQMRRDIGKLF